MKFVSTGSGFRQSDQKTSWPVASLSLGRLLYCIRNCPKAVKSLHSNVQ
jgi:hypothetical protein